MCGIVGYIGPDVAYPLLLTGLKRLEYRGYDSAGIATKKIASEIGFSDSNVDVSDSILIYKEQGKVANLEGKGAELVGNMGLAHTRWSTHGEPNSVNAHPHTNMDGSLVLVHNGIIENYLSIKKKLEAKGYSFRSQTDTEVLVMLIDYHFQKLGDMELALRASLHDVVGAYGIVLFHKDEDKLYAARKGSPLVLGIGNGENFVASDPAAFLDRTRRVLYLEDDDILIVGKDSYELKSLCKHNGECIKRKEDHIDWDIAAVEKNGYDHFMLKEIHEQPVTLANCLAGRIDKMFGDIRLSINLPVSFVRGLRRICIIACGTSSYAALVGKYLIEKYSRIPVEVEVASEWRYKNPIVGVDDLVVFISQSGETADTLAALKLAKSRGAKTFGVINVVGSSMAREVDTGIYIHAGPEIGVASTKAFTGQVLCLNFLATKIAQIRGDLTQDEIRAIIGKLEQLPKYVSECLELSSSIENVAKRICNAKSVFFLGRGVNLPVAKEGALKLKEISYIHAEEFASGEMKHGPIALLEDGFPVVTFLSKNDPLFEKNLSSIQEAKARGAFVIVVTDHVDSTIALASDCSLQVPVVPDYIMPIVNTIPMQLLSYYVAKERGCSIDQPKNLAKSVTVE